MSNHIVSEVHKRKLGSLARMAVMALLADKASDDGSGIWASKQTMADELDTTKPTVRAAIQGLIEDKLLEEVGQRPCQAGYTVEYRIDVAALRRLPLVRAHREKGERSLTGQAALPVKPVDRSTSVTGQAAIREGSSSFTQTSLEPINNTPPPPRAGGRKKRVEISDCWKVPDLAALPDNARIAVNHWPAGTYAAQAEVFLSEHRGTGSRRADWDALWAAYVLRIHGKVMRDAKAGVLVTAPVSAADAPRMPARSVPFTPAKARENDRSEQLHARLSYALGSDVWERWFMPAALIFDGEGLTVVSPTQTHRERLETYHAMAISAALDALGWGVDWTRFDVMVHPPRRAKAPATG
jgi:hypothetical protein